MASLDDVTAGFVSQWDDLVKKNVTPQDVLTHEQGTADTTKRAQRVGRIMAAEKFASIKKNTGA